MADKESGAGAGQVHELSVEQPIWNQFFTVAPLTLVSTIEEDGSHDIAPKHMAMPLGWSNYFCFACSPNHATQRNAQRTGGFTVSYPRPGGVVEVSMAAGPRDEEGDKPTLAAIPVHPAKEITGVLVSDAYLWLECRLERVIEGYGENSLIVGEVVAAAVAESALRRAGGDDADLIATEPLLAYLSPGRFARISESYSFPFHVDFKR